VSRKSIFSVITFGLLAVATTSCGSGEAPKPTESKAPQSAANATPAANPVVAPPASTFSQPLVAAQAKETEKKAEDANAEKPADAIVAGLLPASDSDSVVRSTAKGRTDPFSGVVLQTTTETQVTKTTQASSPTQPAKTTQASSLTQPTKTTQASSLTQPTKTTQAPSLTQPPRIASSSVGSGVITASPRSIPNSVKSPRKTGAGIGSAAATLAKKAPESPISKVTPNSKPFAVAIKPVNTPGLSTPTTSKPNSNPEVAIRNTPPSVAPAPIPQANLARAIAISGVSQINGQTQVIVKLPTESFSRYVSVGERLIDGKVLIKRVEDFSSASPVVILEEVGIEVSRKIGDKLDAEKNDVKK
jgi:hypothetical protein